MARLCHGSHGSGVDAGDGILGRQRRVAGDESVDAGGVGVQHHFRSGACRLAIRPGRVLQPVPAHLHVRTNGRIAGRLGPAAHGAESVVLHGPQPVLRGYESLGEPGVVLANGADVRDAPLIAPDPHVGLQARQVEHAVQGRKGGLQIMGSEGGGFDGGSHRDNLPDQIPPSYRRTRTPAPPAPGANEPTHSAPSSIVKWAVGTTFEWEFDFPMPTNPFYEPKPKTRKPANPHAARTQACKAPKPATAQTVGSQKTDPISVNTP